MSGYFIDTFELTYKTSYDNMQNFLKKYAKRLVDKKHKIWEVRLPPQIGIHMITKKCSKWDKHDKGKNYKFVITVSTDNIPYKKDKTEHIYDFDGFMEVIRLMNEFIELRLPGENINSLELTRIDITKDIQGIPEPMIQEYILMMRNIFSPCYFDFNKQLEENTKGFRKEDSFNALRSWKTSSEVEFVVYNKHRAAVDKNMSDKELEFYKDTLRMEIRCFRRFYRERVKGLSTIDALKYIFIHKEDIARSIYDEVFIRYNDVCFMQDHWLKKMIVRKNSGKEKKCKKMLWLADRLSYKKHPPLFELLDEYSKDRKSQTRLLNYFSELGAAPFPIKNKDIPFMQSIESLLEFQPTTENDRKLFKYLKKKTRGKQVFLHESDDVGYENIIK